MKAVPVSGVTALCSWDTSSASQNLCFNLTVLHCQFWDAVQRAHIPQQGKRPLLTPLTFSKSRGTHRPSLHLRVHLFSCGSAVGTSFCLPLPDKGHQLAQGQPLHWQENWTETSALQTGPKSWHGHRGHLPSSLWAEVSWDKTRSIPFVYDMKQAVPWRYGQCC